MSSDTEQYEPLAGKKTGTLMGTLSPEDYVSQLAKGDLMAQF